MSKLLKQYAGAGVAFLFGISMELTPVQGHWVSGFFLGMAAFWFLVATFGTKAIHRWPALVEWLPFLEQDAPLSVASPAISQQTTAVRNLDKYPADAPPPTIYEISAYDKKWLRSLVVIEPKQLVHWRLEGLNPCLVMTFTVFNASVYRVEIIGVRGTFRIENEVLPGTPECKPESNVVDHGSYGPVTLSLPINQATANLLLAHAVEGGKVTIVFHELEVLIVARQVDDKPRGVQVHNSVAYEFRSGEWRKVQC
jgi:hypothetical protein